MKYVKHPATIIAALALFVALGGGAAWASGLISGSQIEDHSIASKKLTKSAIKSLHGQKGSKGDAGATGASGAPGANGANGANGAPGTNGANGANGAPGPAGPPGPSGSDPSINKYHVLISPGAADVVVDHNGALSIVAHCDTTGPEADLYVRSTVDHATMDAQDQNNDFGPADTTINWASPSSGSGNFEANNDDGVAVAPDGSVITMVSASTGFDIGSSPGQCIFAGANING